MATVHGLGTVVIAWWGSQTDGLMVPPELVEDSIVCFRLVSARFRWVSLEPQVINGWLASRNRWSYGSQELIHATSSSHCG